MSQTELQYESLRQMFSQVFRKHQLCVLATSNDDHVRAGNMRYVADGMTLYCFTGKDSRKYKQMQSNQNVAIVMGNLQIEGHASLLDHPFNEPEFLSAYEKAHPDAYERHYKRYFEGSKDMRVIKITPVRVAAFVANEPPVRPTLDILDVVRGKAFRVDAIDLSSSPDYK